MMSDDDDVLLPREIRKALRKSVQQLRAQLETRLLQHAEPDVTQTCNNLRAFLAFLIKIKRSVRTRRGAQTLLHNRALFDANRLFRPTLWCTQAQFEAERDAAVSLWCQLITQALNAVHGDNTGFV